MCIFHFQLTKASGSAAEIDLEDYVRSLQTMLAKVDQFASVNNLELFGQDIISRLSGFNASSLPQIPAILDTLMNIDPADLDFAKPLYQSLVELSRGTELYAPLRSYFSVATVYMRWMTSVLDRLDLRNGTLEIGALFDEAGQWQQILERTLSLDETTLSQLYNVSLHLNKVR